MIIQGDHVDVAIDESVKYGKLVRDRALKADQSEDFARQLEVAAKEEVVRIFIQTEVRPQVERYFAQRQVEVYDE